MFTGVVQPLLTENVLCRLFVIVSNGNTSSAYTYGTGHGIIALK